MKQFIAMMFFLLVGLVAAAEENVCFNEVESACQRPGANLDIRNCNSLFKEMDPSKDLLSYPNDQLSSSYDYLVLSTFFNSYQKSRPGFVKLFRSLSDQAFENSFKLMQQITHRGGVVDINMVTPKTANLDLDELKSLAKALDTEKALFKKAMRAHAHFSKHIDHREPLKSYDPEMSQFLEEEFLSKQSANIRQLSGYTNDLWKIMKNGDDGHTPLGVYMFDQYLEKQ